MKATPFLLLFVLALTLFVGGGCGNKAGSTCEPMGDCGKDLVCADPAMTNLFHCMTMEDANSKCRASEQCTRSGNCSYLQNLPVCAATKPEDCKASTDCKKNGLCGLSTDHFCVVANDGDCQSSEGCRTGGKCTKRTNSGAGECVRSAPPRRPE